MKTNLNEKPVENVAAAVERKDMFWRVGTKTFAHRRERRKLREQLRHLNWAMAGEN